VVLDDDPTGTQTVHDIPVLTEWTVSSILQEFRAGTPLFYILTNSRSVTEDQAVEIIRKCSRRGKIIVEPVTRAIDIATGEEGDKVI